MAQSASKTPSKRGANKNMLPRTYVMAAGGIALLCLLAQVGTRAALQIVASSAVIAAMGFMFKELAGKMMFAGKAKPKHEKRQAAKALRSFLLPYMPWLRTFEDRLEEKMRLLRFKFTVDVQRNHTGESKKVGLQLIRPADQALHLEVQGVTPNSLIDELNKDVQSSGPRSGKVMAGDELVKVNTSEVAPIMMEEMANLAVTEFNLHFARPAKQNQHFQLWEVELEKLKKDEPWGMQLDDLPDYDGLVVQRVIAGGVVSRWNRKAAQRCKQEQTIYPGDWILACETELAASKFTDVLRTSSAVRLTLLRWRSVAVADSEETRKESRGDSTAVEVSDTPEQVLADESEAGGAHKTTVESVSNAPQCTCCSQNCDKYVVMRCAAGEVKHYRRECWRKAHGGFTQKQCPKQCACGASVSSIGVYEWCLQTQEARLVHTIKTAAPVPQPAANNARRRASSARRAVTRTFPVVELHEEAGDAVNADAPQANARRRGASSDRVAPRFAVPAQEAVEDLEFWRPARLRREAPAPDLLSPGISEAADVATKQVPTATSEQTSKKCGTKKSSAASSAAAVAKTETPTNACDASLSRARSKFDDGATIHSPKCADSKPDAKKVTIALAEVPVRGTPTVEARPTLHDLRAARPPPPPIPEKSSMSEAQACLRKSWQTDEQMWQCNECGYKLNRMHWTWCYVCQVEGHSPTATDTNHRIDNTMSSATSPVASVGVGKYEQPLTQEESPDENMLSLVKSVLGRGRKNAKGEAPVAASVAEGFRAPPGLDIMDSNMRETCPGMLSPMTRDIFHAPPGLVPPPPGLGLANQNWLADTSESSDSHDKHRRWGVAAAACSAGVPVTPGYLNLVQKDEHCCWK